MQRAHATVRPEQSSYVIDGLLRDGHVRLWIDRKTLLVKRVEAERDKERAELEFSYLPSQ